MTSELLQQVRVIDPVSGSDRSSSDVLIADGVIKAVAQQISDYPADTQIKDCRGLVLGPGLVDLYSHSGEPGFEERETLATLFAAATAGGFTRLNILPDTTPPLDNPAGLAKLQQQWQQVRGTEAFLTGLPGLAQIPQLSFWGALTLGVQGQQMTELAELAATSGVAAARVGICQASRKAGRALSLQPRVSRQWCDARGFLLYTVWFTGKSSDRPNNGTSLYPRISRRDRHPSSHHARFHRSWCRVDSGGKGTRFTNYSKYYLDAFVT